MGKLWMIFKKYGTVFDMFMVQRRLRNGKIYGFVRRRNNDGAVGTDGVVHGNRVKKMNNGGVKENREIAFNRDDKRFVDVVNGRNARPTRNHIDKEAKEEGTIPCNRKIEVNGVGFTYARSECFDIQKEERRGERCIEIQENEVNMELMMRSVVGEVKARGFLTKLPVLCEEQGLKYLECITVDLIREELNSNKE
ncbi:hypothetical protein Tco_0490511 [Tanacetum coccineum]